MRTKWDEVMDAQLGVADSFTAEHIAKTVPLSKWSEEGQRDWAIITRLGIQGISQATPVFIEEEILNIGEAACKSFVPEPAHVADFFTPTAFALFERPVVLTATTPDAIHPERPLYTNACMWHWDYDEAGNLGGMITFFQHIKSDAQIDGDLSRMQPWYLQHPWSQVGFIALREGETPNLGSAVFDEDIPLDDVELHGVKLVQTLIRLAQQPLTQNVEALAPRAARRRAMRAGQDFGKNITTITLRRTKRELHEDHEAKRANYSHRFIVHGFWRNQWFPSLKRHKQMWIHDFVKGDPDLPLVIKERRFDFRR